MNMPDLPDDPSRIHWSFDDPSAATGDHDAKLVMFRRVRDEIQDRV
jgi:arsenate reductase